MRWPARGSAAPAAGPGLAMWWSRPLGIDRAGIAGGDDGAGGVDRGIGPEDPHRLGRRGIDEAVWNAGGNPGGVVGAHLVLDAVQLGNGIAFQHHDAFLAIMGM